MTTAGLGEDATQPPARPRPLARGRPPPASAGARRSRGGAGGNSYVGGHHRRRRTTAAGAERRRSPAPAREFGEPSESLPRCRVRVWRGQGDSTQLIMTSVFMAVLDGDLGRYKTMMAPRSPRVHPRCFQPSRRRTPPEDRGPAVIKSSRRLERRHHHRSSGSVQRRPADRAEQGVVMRGHGRRQRRRPAAPRAPHRAATRLSHPDPDLSGDLDAGYASRPRDLLIQVVRASARCFSASSAASLGRNGNQYWPLSRICVAVTSTREGAALDRSPARPQTGRHGDCGLSRRHRQPPGRRRLGQRG